MAFYKKFRYLDINTWNYVLSGQHRNKRQNPPALQAGTLVLSAKDTPTDIPDAAYKFSFRNFIRNSIFHIECQFQKEYRVYRSRNQAVSQSHSLVLFSVPQDSELNDSNCYVFYRGDRKRIHDKNELGEGNEEILNFLF